MLGIEVHQTPVPGMISFYEEHQARRDSGYNLIEWESLTPRQRAIEVAMFRISHSIEYQKMKASESDAKRKNK